MNPQFDFGEHQESVLELLSFVERRQILSRPFDPTRFSKYRTKLITDLEDVERFREGFHPHAEIDSRYMWYDMQMEDAARLGEIRDAQSDYYFEMLESQINDAVQQVRRIVDDQCGAVLPERERWEIEFQFRMGLAARALLGINDTFEESLMQVYLAYGFPCGWFGDWETGGLVAYTVER